jgi:hypothetical protein
LEDIIYSWWEVGIRWCRLSSKHFVALCMVLDAV